MHRIITAFGIMLCSMLVMGQALAVDIQGVRMWPAPDNTRLVFDLNGPVEHTLFRLHKPERIVIDLHKAHLRTSLKTLKYDDGNIKGVRYARRNGKDVRIVLDLKRAVQPKSFALKPQREYGDRLVIDLFDKQSRSQAVVQKRFRNTIRSRDLIIAIDAGHGGDDPGAIGPRRTREKDVVLAIAKKLNSMIKKERGMRPVMIRKGDYFLSLKQRVNIARKYQADLFISIHADAFHKPQAKGSSVYILSDGKSSSEVARFLADSENNSDLIGGVSLDDKGDLLKMVLVDMVQNNTIEDSHQVAKSVLTSLRGVSRLHKHRVEQAGFRVLKAPDVPSILVETAFISNPTEEKRLRSSHYQQKLAQAMLTGIRNYFRVNAPKGTLLAQAKRRHRISRGETLSEIAQRYQVSVPHLRRTNGLRGDHLNVGDTLNIPVSGSS